MIDFAYSTYGSFVVVKVTENRKGMRFPAVLHLMVRVPGTDVATVMEAGLQRLRLEMNARVKRNPLHVLTPAPSVIDAEVRLVDKVKESISYANTDAPSLISTGNVGKFFQSLGKQCGIWQAEKGVDAAKEHFMKIASFYSKSNQAGPEALNNFVQRFQKYHERFLAEYERSLTHRFDQQMANGSSELNSGVVLAWEPLEMGSEIQDVVRSESVDTSVGRRPVRDLFGRRKTTSSEEQPELDFAEQYGIASLNLAD